MNPATRQLHADWSQAHTPHNTWQRTDIQPRAGCIVAVCISPGGIPKLPVDRVRVSLEGLEGDGHAHAKHCRPDRAVSLLDLEVMQALVAEGFPLVPGATGENLTVRGLDVQALAPGTLLRVGEAIVRLTSPRKPCYVLDAIDPRLKEAIVGRCGYLAEVLVPGVVRSGDAACVVTEGNFPHAEASVDQLAR